MSKIYWMRNDLHCGACHDADCIPAKTLSETMLEPVVEDGSVKYMKCLTCGRKWKLVLETPDASLQV